MDKEFDYKYVVALKIQYYKWHIDVVALGYTITFSEISIGIHEIEAW
jgi:hypothetical protein